MKNLNLFKKVVFVAVIMAGAVMFVSTETFAQSAPKQEKLLNGLKVLLWSDPKADKVRVSLRIHSGAAFDPQGKEGVMQLLADNIFPNEAAKEFFVEDLGGGLEIITGYDYIQINVSSKAGEEYLTMLETLSTAVASPTIDKETTAKLKAALLAKLKTMETDPAYVADRATARRLLGTFPYGRSIVGTSESVGSIDFADLIDAKQRFLAADNATITISGNFDRAQGYRAIRRYFGSWLKSDKRVPSSFTQPEIPQTGLMTVASPKPDVAALRFAMRGVARISKDLAASMVFSNILETRLKARVPSAHANDVFVKNEAHTQPGTIVIGFAAGKNEVGSGNGKIEANDLISKALNDAVTEAEFQAGRSAVAANWAKRYIEQFWLDLDTYKLVSVDADRTLFDKVTFDDVRSYAEKARTSPIVSVLVNTPAN
ncbi:MAG: insulinase family protein [Pyrinomonadaceae bacterium]